MKLIDADAVLVALRDYWAEGTNETGMEVLDKIIVSLENKGADAEPVKHGKWLMNDAYGTYCSECGSAAFEITGRQYSKMKTRYCWQCGAKMHKEEL